MNDAQSRRVPKILLVSFVPLIGGGEIYLERLAQLLQQDAQIFAVCANAELKTRLQRHCKSAYLLPRGSLLGKYHAYIAAPFFLLWVVLRNNIRVVQFNGPVEAILAPLVHLLACRVILTRHTNLNDEVSRPKQALYRWTSRHVDLVVCVSQAIADQHRPFLAPAKLVVIQNWIPAIPAVVLPKLIPNKRVLFVGRLLLRKGLHLLLNAMRSMPGWELLILGEGPERALFEKQASDIPVTFLGFEPDPSRHYMDVDFLVHPSLGPEGCSLVPIEAMAHGLPCILSDLLASREMADNGKAAMLTPAGDQHALLVCMQQLAADSSLRAALALHGHDFVQRRYSEDAVRPAYLRAFGIATALENDAA